MNQFLNSLRDPAWWIMVVAVGIAINIASNLVQRSAGYGFRSLLLRLLRLKDADDRRVARDAELVRGSEVIRTAFISRQIGASMRTVISILMGIFFFTVVERGLTTAELLGTLLVSLCSMGLAVWNVARAQYCQLVIDEAAKRAEREQEH
jgi:hypothetical protein